jgi:hypothetical protein
MFSAAANGYSFSYQGGYLNFSICLTKNVLCELKKNKSQNKFHFVENKIDSMQQELTLQQIFFLPKYLRGISSGQLLQEFTYANRAL